MSNMAQSPLLRAKQAAAFLAISKTTFHRWVQSGRLPKGIALGPGATVWRRAELEAFVSTMEGESRGESAGEAHA